MIDVEREGAFRDATAHSCANGPSVAPLPFRLAMRHPSCAWALGLLSLGVVAASLVACADSVAPVDSHEVDPDGMIAYVLRVRGEGQVLTEYLVVRSMPTGEESVVLSTNPTGIPANPPVPAEAYIEGFAWAPDGATVLVGLTAPVTNKVWDGWLARFSWDGSGGERIFDGAGPERFPVYSRFGRLAYLGGAEIGPEWGLYVDGVRVSPGGFSHKPAWLPDGMALMIGGSRVKVEDGEVTTILPESDAVGVSQPAVSSAGAIAFTRTPYSTGISEVWVADPSGGSQRWVARGHSPAWSPDGSWLVYLRDWHEARLVHVATGSDRYLFRVEQSMEVREPAWLP
jgi:hypothetical protein